MTDQWLTYSVLIFLIMLLLIMPHYLLRQANLSEQPLTQQQDHLYNRTGQILAEEDAAWIMSQEEQGNFRFSPHELQKLLVFRFERRERHDLNSTNTPCQQ